MSKQYDILCAWCLKKGIRTVIGTSDKSGETGICKPCEDEFKAELDKLFRENGDEDEPTNK